MLKLPVKGKWLIGVSGGPDSMALLSMCLREGIDCAAAHVNYHHREQAEAEEASVRQFCRSHNVPVHVLNEPFVYKGNFEAAAREHRYRFFLETVREYGYCGVLIAHQQDDLLETWFMQKEKNLIPETYGLAETMRWNGMLVCRPLLDRTAAELRLYCQANQVPYWIDATNQSREYARNRIREDVVSGMPDGKRQEILREISAANHHLELVRRQAGRLLQSSGILLDAYRCASPEVRVTALRKLIRSFPPEKESVLSAAFLREIDAVLMKQRDFVVSLKNSDIVTEAGFVFLQKKSRPFSFRIENKEQLSNCFHESFRIAEGEPGVCSVTVQEEDFPLTIRSWQEGDFIEMRYGRKSLHRFFIDRHIPRGRRSSWPVVVNASGSVILVPGLGCDKYHYSIKPDFSVLQYSNSKGAFGMLEKNIKQVLVSHEEIISRCEELGLQITEDYRENPPLLVALLRGSVPFLAELIQHIRLDIQYDFMDVKSYEGTESTGEIKIIKDLDTSIKGMDILLVEDIVDTGRTIKTVIDTLKHKGAASVKVVSLLDKPDRRVVEMEPDYVGFTIDNLFVVGYGLDFNQHYRALPYIGVLKDECYQ